MATLRIGSGWRLSLAQQFMIGSLAVLALSMVGIGAWVARQIEDGVVQRTAATTALYVDSLIAPSLQDLAEAPTLSEESADRLEWLFADTPLGQEVSRFHVWDRDGRIVFSTLPGLTGTLPTPDPELSVALAGRVAASIDSAEGVSGAGADDLLEIYSPVRSRGSDQVIAVAEFYYAADDLRAQITNAQRQSWFVVGGATSIVYLLLAAFVGRASDTITRQQRVLSDQVTRLTDLLRQNDELHQRVRGAAARTVALNERFLRRFSAELHDGPAQDISLALLRLDNVAAHHGAAGEGQQDDPVEAEITLIQTSLRRALQELRATSSGILLPQLSALTVRETLQHAIRGHRRRTGAPVTVQIGDVPEDAPLATKIALYRVTQEALTNTERHAAGAAISVVMESRDGALRVEIADEGPGFDLSSQDGASDRLGLIGMRERAESLGGALRVESAPGAGTRVIVDLPVGSGGGDE